MDTEINGAQAAAIAAELTTAACKLYIERLRNLGIVQEDPEDHVKRTYMDMLLFVRDHHGMSQR